MDFPTSYGLQYPIQKTTGPWLVIGITCFADQDERHQICGPVHSIDIHLDADDPNFAFADPKDRPELPPQLVEQFNAPHRRSVRLARRRMVEFDASYLELDANAERAAAHMEMTRRRRERPRDSICGTVGRWTVGFVPTERD